MRGLDARRETSAANLITETRVGVRLDDARLEARRPQARDLLVRLRAVVERADLHGERFALNVRARLTRGRRGFPPRNLPSTCFDADGRGRLLRDSRRRVRLLSPRSRVRMVHRLVLKHL